MFPNEIHIKQQKLERKMYTMHDQKHIMKNEEKFITILSIISHSWTVEEINFFSKVLQFLAN